MSKISNFCGIEILPKQLSHKEILDMSFCSTLFSQTLAFVPRHIFQKLERRHKTGRSSRKFGFKEQFTVMAFIQLAARRSMRDALRCLSSLGSHLYHFGLKNVARSTFSDANNTRPVAFFQDLFAEMYKLCSTCAPRHNFRFKSKLFSLDASTIKLCLSVFPWASFRQRKAGIKMHTLLDHDGNIPAFVAVTEAKMHESRLAKTLDLPAGSIVVFDKGYNDYGWFRTLGAKGVHFVTRLKKNAGYKVIERYPVDRKSGVTSDQTIEVSQRGKTLCLRRVGYYDHAMGKHYTFLTNHFCLSAKTIADIYKDRWQIEIFFREIKQNLRIKSFVGNSENAVLTQIYSALTVYLILAYQKFTSKLGLSIQQICQLIQVNLIGSASLDDLLNPRRRCKQNPNQLSLLELAA